MAGKIQGITIEIAGKTSGLVASLKEADKALSATQSALKQVNKALELDPKNVELITQKEILLGQAVDETGKRLNALKEAAELAADGLEKGTVTKDQYAQLTAEIALTEQNLEKLADEAENSANSMDDLADNTAEAGEEAEKGSKALEAFGEAAQVAGEVASAAMAAVAAGFTAATAVAAAFTKVTVDLVANAVQGYAEIEQLEGGIEKLFGDSAEQVIANANDAYLTAGMNAQEYMSTATSISASLLNSLGGDTAAAAEMTDTAIRAMADNASVFGTDLQTIQNAFVGFSRGNFNMLDSLSLGFAGTKEGMVDLINASGIFEQELDNLDNVSFADMVSAINAVQESMGIAGNQANEALETISGSVDATKNAWANLVTGLADPNADIGQLIENLITTGMAALENITPAVERALQGISTALPTLVGQISQKLPGIIQTILPPLLTAVGELIRALSEALPELMGAVEEVLPDVLQTVLSTLSDSVDLIISVVGELIDIFIQSVNDNLDQVLETAVTIIEAIITGLAENTPEIIPSVLAIVTKISEVIYNNLDTLIQSALEIIITIANGLVDHVSELVPAVANIILDLVDYFLEHLPEFITLALDLMVELASGLVEAIPEIVARIPEIVTSIIEAFGDLGVQLWEKAPEWGLDLIDGFVQGIRNGWDTLVGTLTEFGETVKDFIGFSEPDKGPLSNFHTFAPDMVDLWTEGVEANLGQVATTMNTFGNVVAVGATDYSGQLTSINNGIGQIAAQGGGTIVIPVTIGGESIDTIVIDALDRTAYLSGV